VVDAFERFQPWLARRHVPSFLEMSLTLAQMKALYLVAAAGPMRMSEVAERLGTAASTASGVIDGLVQRGLIDRVEDPADRRQVHVRATPAAQEQLEHVHELGRGHLRQMLASVERDEDLRTIEVAIDILTDAEAATEDTV
jgi:DNA-binding MarR family transcriptional regulator